MKFIRELLEAKVARTDPEMDEYYDKQEAEQHDMREGPYYVGWSGQSLEWYGDDDLKKGRYKPKGDGGKIVAINVPTHEEARKIAKALDDAYRDDKFPYKAVYGRMGKDGYVVDYHGAFIHSMKKMDNWDEHRVQYDHPADYKKGGKFKL